MDVNQASEALIEVCGIEGSVSAEDTLQALEVDSIDLLEWLYTLDERHELNLDLDAPELFDGLLDLPLSEVTARLVSMARPLAPQRAS